MFLNDSIFRDYNYIEKNTDNINEIFDLCNNYDFVIINTKNNITTYKNPMIIILLENKNDIKKYYCSNKFIFYNNCKDVIKIKNLEFDYYGLLNSYCIKEDNCFIKYIEKYDKKINKENFELTKPIKEIEINNNENLKNLYFVKNQKIIFYEETDNYYLICKNKINGFTLTKKYVYNIDIQEKQKILLNILEKLSILENNGFIYNDLSFKNIMFDKNINEYVLVDLNSYFIKEKNKKLLNLKNTNENYNLSIELIIFIYNLFKFKNLKEVSNIYNASTYKSIFKTNNYEISFLIKRFFNELDFKNFSYNDVYNFFKKNSLNNNSEIIKNIFINKYGN